MADQERTHRRTSVLLGHLMVRPAVVAAADAPQCPRVEMSPGGPQVSQVICGMARWTGGSAQFTPAQCLAAVKGSIALGVTTFATAQAILGSVSQSSESSAAGSCWLLI